jgi:hypothetical protein
LTIPLIVRAASPCLEAAPIKGFASSDALAR